MSFISNIHNSRVGFGIVVATATIITLELLRSLNSLRAVGDALNKGDNLIDSGNALDDTANGHMRHHVIPSPRYQQGLQGFVNAANRALMSAYPQARNTGPQRYSRVSVLLLLWETDDLGVETEISQLSNVFRDRYGYDCDIFAIPEQSEEIDPDAALVNRITAFKRGALQDHLLIVYYGGHSDDGTRKHSIWKSKLGSSSSVNWSLAQPYLLTCPANVLVLLDTCFAARGGQDTAGATVGSNELIAATNESSLAPGVNRFSFTNVLIEVLTDFAERHRQARVLLSAVWLCSHMRTHYHDHKLKKVPFYMTFDDYRSQSAVIIPRPGSTYAYLSSINPPPALDIGPYRVMVSIELNGTPTGDIVTWLEGQGAPANYITHVEIIQIAAVYGSNSSVLVITIPPVLWLLLPPELAGNFVGLVQSGNLLSKGKEIQRIRDRPTQTEMNLNDRISDVSKADLPPPYEEVELRISKDIIAQELLLQFEFEAWQRAGDSRARLHSAVDEEYQWPDVSAFGGEFRLIRLLPGEHEDDLYGKCAVVDIGDAPSYMALSYVWGPPYKADKKTEWISMDGITMQLRPNLSSALRALRDRAENIHVWVDTLCINNYDAKDRARQTSLMPAIYRHARVVVVWLGGSSHFGRHVFSFTEWVVEHPDLLLTISVEDLYTSFDAFFTMMRNRWFQKRWVVADYALANEVVLRYGYDVLPWNTLAKAMYIIRYSAATLLQKFLARGKYSDDFLKMLYDFEFQAANQSISLRDDLQQELTGPLVSSPRTVISSLVLRTSLLSSSIPQDALISMRAVALEWYRMKDPQMRNAEAHLNTEPSDTSLAMIQKPEPTALIPARSALIDLHTLNLSELLPPVNYTTPVEEFFAKFVRQTICNTRKLDIICQPWAPEVENIPSWIRTRKHHAFAVMQDDRCSRINGDNLATPSSLGRSIYSASGPDCRLTEVEADKIASYKRRQLIVGGLYLGTVDAQTERANKGRIPAEWFEFGRGGGASPSSENMLWRTLVADRGPDGTACPAWYEVAYHRVLSNRKDWVLFNDRGPVFDTIPGIVFDYLKRVRAIIWERVLFRTDINNYFGLAPGSSQVGDQVWLLKGCSVPVVLRPRPYLHTTYKLIGECYVHGMMDGEIFEVSNSIPSWISILLDH